MSRFVVVDASLTVRLAREEDSDNAPAILSDWHDDGITPAAPHLLPFEVANALHRKVLRGQLSVGGSTRMIERLPESRLKWHQAAGLHTRAMHLAGEFQ